MSQIPEPIPFVPDVPTFLSLIGRGLSQHASKFPTWEALFSLTSPELKELGVEPPRTRRYLLRWRQKFREGIYGIGGDLKYVDNGTAELRVIEYNDNPMKPIRHVVNVPTGKTVDEVSAEERVRVKGFKVVGARAISGPYALPMKKNAGSVLTAAEGMWEDKRGRKIDGGERRRAEVRFKKGVAERKALRETQGMY